MGYVLAVPRIPSVPNNLVIIISFYTNPDISKMNKFISQKQDKKTKSITKKMIAEFI